MYARHASQSAANADSVIYVANISLTISRFDSLFSKKDYLERR
jgi:hypothetical protein